MSADWKKAIYNETMKSTGFLELLRENQIDEAAYTRLLTAIQEGARACGGEDQVDRLVLACLFEVPFEVANTKEHYANRNEVDGRRVLQMSEEVREAINEMLWTGLESHYENTPS